MSQAAPATTAGSIAVRNLNAQIDGRRGARPATTADRTALIDLLLLRGHLLGRIIDTEQAADEAERVAAENPDSGPAYLARARTRAAMHQFSAAIDDLDRARHHGADPATIHAEHATILEATGNYDEAMPLRHDAVTDEATFATLAGLASHYAACGNIHEAERHYSQSRALFCGVSPFPLATLDFHRGHMWLTAGEYTKAAQWFTESVTRLPDYLPAHGHLATAEAALGDTDTAIQRLRRATHASDDPEYPAQLARLLSDIGASDESNSWRDHAIRRYDELLTRHPEAFADHAAELWLWSDTDPTRAIRLARLNYQLRPTTHAHDLLARAIRAVCPTP